MESMIPEFEKMAMLDAVGREIGLAVWDLQDVEWMLAQYAVMVLPEMRGVGMEAAAPVLAKWEKKTFGRIVSELSAADHLDDALAARLSRIVEGTQLDRSPLEER